MEKILVQEIIPRYDRHPDTPGAREIGIAGYGNTYDMEREEAAAGIKAGKLKAVGFRAGVVPGDVVKIIRGRGKKAEEEI